jgi:hypothetical protein
MAPSSQSNRLNSNGVESRALSVGHHLATLAVQAVNSRMPAKSLSRFSAKMSRWHSLRQPMRLASYEFGGMYCKNCFICKRNI